MDCLAVDFLLTLPDEIGADTVDNGDDDFLEEVVAMEIEVCCLRCHAELYKAALHSWYRGRYVGVALAQQGYPVLHLVAHPLQNIVYIVERGLCNGYDLVHVCYGHGVKAVGTVQSH